MSNAKLLEGLSLVAMCKVKGPSSSLSSINGVDTSILVFGKGDTEIHISIKMGKNSDETYSKILYLADKIYEDREHIRSMRITNWVNWEASMST
jgi:hypothetical protein